MQMIASIVKEIARAKKEEHFHVAIMPCTAKKFEGVREEFIVDGDRNVNAVLTTNGLIRMIKESGIMFKEIEPEAVDSPFGTVSGAGVLFGVTGGVTEAVLRKVANSKTRTELFAISQKGQRGEE